MNEERVSKAKEKRKYERQTINDTGDQRGRIEVIVEGEVGRLVNYSLGGMFVIFEKVFFRR